MFERIALFAFILLCILLSLGGSIWLILNHQASSVEGIFLLLTCGVIVLVSGLSVRFLIKS